MKKTRSKVLAFVAVIALLALVGPVTVNSAGTGGEDEPVSAIMAGSKEGNGSDPNYVPSDKELQQRVVKEAWTAERSTATASGDYSKILSVGVWLEPSGSKYVNHCGPAATQVALSARLNAKSIPGIDTIAKEEKTNQGKTGTYMQDIVPVLNKRLNTKWYSIGNAKDQSTLASWIRADMDNNYAMVTGLKTGRMPGWGKTDVTHIVAVYGFKQPAKGTATVYYTETAHKDAGFTGSMRNSVSLSDFWGYVSRNNIQAW